MKTVLSLSLVLAGIASASTGYEFSQPGTYMYEVGWTYTLEITMSGDMEISGGGILFQAETTSNRVDAQIQDVRISSDLFEMSETPFPSYASSLEGHYYEFLGPWDSVEHARVMEIDLRITGDINPDGEPWEYLGDLSIGMYPFNVPQAQYDDDFTNLYSDSTTYLDGTVGEFATFQICAPEPASLMLLAIGGLAVIRRR